VISEGNGVAAAEVGEALLTLSLIVTAVVFEKVKVLLIASSPPVIFALLELAGWESSRDALTADLLCKLAAMRLKANSVTSRLLDSLTSLLFLMNDSDARMLAPAMCVERR
jgi:hypothetical protein